MKTSLYGRRSWSNHWGNEACEYPVVWTHLHISFNAAHPSINHWGVQQSKWSPSYSVSFILCSRKKDATGRREWFSQICPDNSRLPRELALAIFFTFIEFEAVVEQTSASRTGTKSTLEPMGSKTRHKHLKQCLCNYCQKGETLWRYRFKWKVNFMRWCICFTKPEQLMCSIYTDHTWH